VLTDAHYSVTAVATGAAALASLAGNERPCVVLFVLHPDDDSLAFHMAQQANAEWSAIPTLLFSAHPMLTTPAFLRAILTMVGRHCEPVLQ
jgi:hypothetical protein